MKRLCLHCGEEIEPFRLASGRYAWRSVTWGMPHETRCADSPHRCHEPELIWHES